MLSQWGDRSLVHGLQQGLFVRQRFQIQQDSPARVFQSALGQPAGQIHAISTSQPIQRPV